MRFGILLCLLLLAACPQSQLRRPASLDNVVSYGEVDPEQSQLKVFPPQINASTFKYYLYLELKNSQGKYVDCDAGEVLLQKPKGQKVAFKLERMLKGRYYLSVEESSQFGQVKLDLLIQKKLIKKGLKLLFKKADRNKSWLKLVNTGRNGLKLKLFLGDSQGKPVEIPSAPEIIIEGEAEVENLERVADGTWEFDLVFPSRNQIIYLSVRAHGTFMADMFRVQHIEK